MAQIQAFTQLIKCLPLILKAVRVLLSHSQLLICLYYLTEINSVVSLRINEMIPLNGSGG